MPQQASLSFLFFKIEKNFLFHRPTSKYHIESRVQKKARILPHSSSDPAGIPCSVEAFSSCGVAARDASELLRSTIRPFDDATSCCRWVCVAPAFLRKLRFFPWTSPERRRDRPERILVGACSTRRPSTSTRQTVSAGSEIEQE
jgi:hypothetical protein